VSEAVNLNFWPKVSMKFPTEQKGQLYIPSINWLLFLGCAGIVLYFKESSKMEAAYGMTIIIGMLMTSTLLVYYMGMKRYSKVTINVFIVN
jgi:KUP system potassium uptake protein